MLENFFVPNPIKIYDVYSFIRGLKLKTNLTDYDINNLATIYDILNFRVYGREEARRRSGAEAQTHIDAINSMTLNLGFKSYDLTLQNELHDASEEEISKLKSNLILEDLLELNLISEKQYRRAVIATPMKGETKEESTKRIIDSNDIIVITSKNFDVNHNLQDMHNFRRERSAEDKYVQLNIIKDWYERTDEKDFIYIGFPSNARELFKLIWSDSFERLMKHSYFKS